MLTHPRRRLVLPVLGVGAVLLAGCGSEGTTSATSGGAGATRSVAAFCKAYDAEAVKNASGEPSRALTVLDKVKDVAPAAIRNEADYAFNALKGAFGGRKIDATRFADAYGAMTKYSVRNCG